MSARVGVTILALALLCLPAMVAGQPGAAPPVAAPWITVVTKAGGLNGPQPEAPGAGLPACDGRLDFRSVAVRDDGDAFSVRFWTAAPSGPASTQPVSSHLSFYVLGFQDGPTLSVSAKDADVSLRAFKGPDDGRGTQLPDSPGAWSFDAGPVAWNWTLHVQRSAWRTDGQYAHGDALSYFNVQLDGSLGDVPYVLPAFPCPGGGQFEQDNWGERVRLQSGGAWPLDKFSQLNTAPWYAYNVRADAPSLKVLVGADGLPQGVFQMTSAGDYYGRTGEPLGIYHVELRGGQLAEQFVAAADPGVDHQPGFPEATTVGFALATDEPHILFHPHPQRGNDSDPDALTHAWRDAGGWHTEPVLAGLHLGSIAVDVRSTLPAVADAHRVVTSVRTADGKDVILLERRDGAWQVLHRFPDTAFVRLGLEPTGSLAVALYHQDPLAKRGVRSFSTLGFAREATGWNEVAVAHGLEDENEWDHNAALAGSFDMALDAAGDPCFAYYATTLEKRSWTPAFRLLCGPLDAPRFNESIAFLADPQQPSHVIRLAVGQDGSLAVVTGYTWAQWYGHRDPDGQWWWEALDHSGIGPSVGVLPDGRAVIGQRANGGHGGLDIQVQHTNPESDLARAFYVGTAADSARAGRGYRDGSTGAAQPSLRPLPSVASDQTTTGPAHMGQAAPGVAPGALVLVLALVGWTRHKARRRPQP